MKGVLIACFVTIWAFAAISFSLRWIGDQARIPIFVSVYAISVAVFFIVHFVTPANLGFLPSGLTEDAPWLDAAVGWFALSASLIGGWLQLLILTNRGYSLRMLIDILESPEGALSPEELVISYAGGQGLDFMYNIRIGGLVAAGLVRIEHGRISLTNSGRRAARLFDKLRAIYKIGERWLVPSR